MAGLGFLGLHAISSASIKTMWLWKIRKKTKKTFQTVYFHITVKEKLEQHCSTTKTIACIIKKIAGIASESLHSYTLFPCEHPQYHKNITQRNAADCHLSTGLSQAKDEHESFWHQQL